MFVASVCEMQILPHVKSVTDESDVIYLCPCSATLQEKPWSSTIYTDSSI